MIHIIDSINETVHSERRPVVSAAATAEDGPPAAESAATECAASEDQASASCLVPRATLDRNCTRGAIGSDEGDASLLATMAEAVRRASKVLSACDSEGAPPFDCAALEQDLDDVVAGSRSCSVRDYMIESVVDEVAEGIAHGVSAVLLGNTLGNGKSAVLLRLLRLLRNCFTARAAQDLATSDPALKEFLLCSVARVVRDRTIPSDIRYGTMQAFANAITAHELNQQLLWSSFWKCIFCEVLGDDDIRLRRIALIALYNFTVHSSERRRQGAGSTQPSVLSTILSLNLATEDDSVLEWVARHARLYFDVGELPYAFPLLRSVDQVASISQREWLLLLLAEVEEGIEREQETVCRESCVESYSFLVVELFRLSASCVQQDNSPVGNEAHVVWESIVALVKLFAGLSSLVSNLPLRTALRQEGLLQVSLELLQQLWEHDSTEGALRSSTAQRPFKSKSCYGLKRELIRTIGNVCYQCKEGQDEVRERGGLPLILNHCVIDENNPYMKEWAILTIRNLCEDNEGNQSYIAGLERKEGERASMAEELANAGVRIEIKHGRVHFKTTDKDTQ